MTMPTMPLIQPIRRARAVLARAHVDADHGQGRRADAEQQRDHDVVEPRGDAVACERGVPNRPTAPVTRMTVRLVMHRIEGVGIADLQHVAEDFWAERHDVQLQAVAPEAM
jgi:hypothetical protein